MAADTAQRKPDEAPVILPADPLGAGLTVIEVEKAEHAGKDAVKTPRGKARKR